MAISPDGKWVLTARLNPAPSQYVLLPTGAGEAKVVTNDSLAHDIGWFSADGTHIVFSGFAPDRLPRLYLQDLAGGAPKPITPEGVIGPPSPDGALVAFDGKLYSTAGAAPRPIPGIEPDDRVEGWASDSGSLFVRRRTPSGEQQVFRLDAATGRRTLVHRVAVPGGGPVLWFTITPDGSAYFMSYGVTQADLYRVTGLK
jgi:Tol biopolymer transport system component